MLDAFVTILAIYSLLANGPTPKATVDREANKASLVKIKIKASEKSKSNVENRPR